MKPIRLTWLIEWISLCLLMDRSSGFSPLDESRIRNWLNARSRDGFLLLDEGGALVFINDVLREWIGERIQGDHIDLERLCADESVKDLAASWNRLRRSGADFRLRMKLKSSKEKDLWVDCQGEALPFDLDGKRLFGLAFRNVTELKLANDKIEELEELITHVQKQETLGLLASGIAHDLNNNLTPITLYASLAERKLETGDLFAKHFRAIRDAANECSALTRQLLGFSRRKSFEPAPISSDLLIKRMEKMLHRLVRDDIALKFSYSERSYGVMVDENQIHQVVLNLLINAQDAMPGSGRIAIEVGVKRFSRGEAVLPERREAGDYASISMVDTGIGISEDIQAHVFEPYFTTKEEGGTGLGLMVCSDIVERHGGFMVFSSSFGEGARFTAYLPKFDAELPDVVNSENGDEMISGSGQIVLVVDDSAPVRGSACLFLSENGYEPLEAGSGEEALGLLGDTRLSVDLILTDVVVPDMSGLDLVEAARRLKPDLPAVCMSGYSREDLDKRVEEFPFVSKPLHSSNLLKIVYEVLNRSEY